ncbi:Endonuclease [Roseomonas mucosa]|uniref:Endonuclease n=1 Tax=Roseomonas mucosa TaxID=207340 RepID=A0A379MYU9_9PROT|nr:MULTISPECIES: DNA/RNA non-specific endonuclease [Roseomonas]MBS5904409.1 DNA/RNA non-specific endonuclease [Acetobacteraceae bacterium]AWV21243.1 Endonuclease [Roseomonas mucosa]MCG7352233.1 DNA/RNA non-specific endonuclease [Roseomonas mucosa]MCG7357535.1 DNA/RNA non-specific endonuclease [Roseomonas mucosa]MDT8277931.1 DNA/RNA non-specific endonuclease [Roseomonas mucosa]
MSRPVIRRWRPLVLILLPALVLLLGAPSAHASEACTRHHPDGVAPSVTRPALERDTSRLCFEGFAVLYSGVSRTPLAVSEHLTRDRIQQARRVPRDDAFHAEDQLPEEQRSRLSDYARSGFDRGHMAPSGDMATPSSQHESFSLANIVPQAPESNRCLWEGVESTVRDLATEDGEVWVVTGPVFQGENLRRLNRRVLVPTSLYKAIYLPDRGVAGAYLAPNGPGLSWRAVSLDELRDIAGINAFPSLAPAIRARAMALPEPTPNNIRGSCEGQTGGQVASSGTASNRSVARRDTSVASPAGPGIMGSRMALVIAAVVAVVVILLLVRVLGRR